VLKKLLTFAVLLITGICAASDDTSLGSKTVLEVLRESKRILWIAAHPEDEISLARSWPGARSCRARSLWLA